MKGNEDKCHVILSLQNNVHVNIGTTQTENENAKSYWVSISIQN